MRRFWNWEHPAPNNNDPAGDDTRRVLRINGVIAEESWFDDDITPALFASELAAGSGDVTVWINSPGGDVVAAAQIYNMLIDYPGHVKVCIDGIAASAASVIAMAGEVVAMSPVSMLMIHNPATLAVGDAEELGRVIDMLAAVKESIINAYELKTGMSRAKLARLMDQETWMDARAAIAMGFADDYLTGSRTPPDPDDENEDGEEPDKQAPWPPKTGNPAPLADTASGVCFARKPAEQRLVAHLTGTPPTTPPPAPEPTRPAGRRVVDLYAALLGHTH
ncbi:Clp protease ClpP [Arcanobacterium haemolyticum]|uniref:ATP-dependent Clp protease proteolytic subunit n=1 Tax=Arcanobacterium haemolyticum (strain ATCC 9345 / DSM 20595 / CCM 5947 / CCUG 17215 / LMG 16163 / NBRC 15585 / NCTC 8452 / 11018) TaxID=644284 RepID=D7BKR2_ARCHD|nr:head maturation protease, ClpP-related [Arcanobacterium haemolyticum]ADH93242.1 peptidase S14 ClpP [Arcanobacterium haemolyticum DSM 20595]QCX47286.1 Clp protease ClpP [Arcanobacterium haemolyticum]SQH27983.1 ATP-dependent Clp protease proteolytic subunit [Arcanobacterium haemolyticum]